MCSESYIADLDDGSVKIISEKVTSNLAKSSSTQSDKRTQHSLEGGLKPKDKKDKPLQ